MQSISKKFHTWLEVWNRYGTLEGAWIMIVPYLPYLPYLPLHVHAQAHMRTCARTHVYEIIIMVWKVWKVWKSRANKGFQLSILVPYLHGGVEGV